MWYIYEGVIRLYGLGILIASFFNEKAALLARGRQRGLPTLPSGSPTIWFHCASLGEFEQGKPLMEMIRTQYPKVKILLSFHSPSGYEIRKNYEGADAICYIPLDTYRNAKEFIHYYTPALAIFIKEELWYNFLRVLEEQQIPIVLVSAYFSEGHYLFNAMGKWFRRRVAAIDHIFVQDEKTMRRLKDKGITSVTVAGNTRVDRALSLQEEPLNDPLIEKFAADSQLMVMGSVWAKDLKIILPWAKRHRREYKFIIAPHDPSPSMVKGIKNQWGDGAAPYSEAHHQLPDEVLIIDRIGLLSRIYPAGRIAYIGGGFGEGIHNILEPAAAGLPVIFGPRHHNFPEAIELQQLGGAMAVSDEREFHEAMEYFSVPANFSKARKATETYFLRNKGTTETIMKYLERNFFENV